jgi:hypothetical protein
MRDCWLIKTDSSGNKLWDKTFGGTADDFGVSVRQTQDGGYIIAGYTFSFGAGMRDCWLIKTDSSGNKLWDKTFGGTRDDMCYNVLQTPDGGYLLVGNTWSFGPDNSGHIWVIKTDSSGNNLWDKTFGGTLCGTALGIEPTGDGAYILAGYTWTCPASNGDAWLMKMDSTGNGLWEATFGGSGHEYAEVAWQTEDGGYVVFCTKSDDAWLIKTDSSGNKVWDKTFGSVQQCWVTDGCIADDGGYIMTGVKHTTYLGPQLYANLWVVKTDSDGNQTWDTTYGYGYGEFIEQTNDGGFVIVAEGYSSSPDYADILLMKLSGNGTPPGDTTPPTSPVVTIDSDATSTSQIRASWTSTDPESGVVEYQYAIGTSAGATNVVGLTSVGTNTQVTKTGLSLSVGITYYFGVSAKNGAGLWSYVGVSEGIEVTAGSDTTPPTIPSVTDEGATTTSDNQLHATWTSTDPESGVVEYQYAIGTSAGATDLVSWTSAGSDTEITHTGLSLTPGTTYYISVKAKNGAGLWSELGANDGIAVVAEGAAQKEDIQTTGGIVRTTDGRITTEFPAGAVTDTVTVTITQVPVSSIAAAPKGFKVGNICFIVEAVDDNGVAIVTFSQPVTITVKYSDEDVAGGDPTKLALAYYDEAAVEWKTLDTTVNTTDKTLSATTTHLSTWAVLAKAAEGNGMPLWVWVVGGIGVAGVAAIGLLTWRRMVKKPVATG